ncbi:MAG: hypothetical protein B6241_08270 [Spirochaetaceae bacterium 4572_59]|nr:MAG: hypothetical protein B6241_08270 [Spirochaetaceae bacterium 4572_59]
MCILKLKLSIYTISTYTFLMISRKSADKVKKLAFHAGSRLHHLFFYLAGIYEESQMNTHPLRRAFFETLVVSDQIKRHLYDKIPPEWYFWSAPRGPEVDLLREQGTSLKAIDIKSSKTFKTQHLKHLHSFSTLSGNSGLSLELKYDGDDEFIQEGVEVRPWQR